MPISVRLDQKTESLVGRLARRTGRTKSEVIREGLQALARAEGGVEGRSSPYEAISHLIGCACGGPRNLSERTGEKLRRLLTSRARR
jgi:hypothetical protein